MSLLDEIKQKSKVDFRPASQAGLDALRALGVPENALAFYQDSEPATCAEIDDVRLWPISDVLGENRDFVPGCYIQPLGYIVFATTVFGDAFCFDWNPANSSATAPLVLIAHDLDWNEIKREEIANLAKPIAPSFESFLIAFVAETLDIEPLYPPFNFDNPKDASP